MDQIQNLNKVLLRSLQFRSKIIEESPECVKDLLEVESRVKKELLSKIKEALSHQEKLIKVALYIEKQSASHGPLHFMCNPSWTVWSAKSAIKEQFERLCEPSTHDLNVLCGCAVAEDYLTLQDCGVHCKGDTVYVYASKKLKKSVDLQYQEGSSSSQSSVGEAVADVLNLLSTSSQCSLILSVNEESGNQNETESVQPCNESTNDVVQPSFVIGWSCQLCTFVNEPTRPGCMQCSSSRPDDYVVPDEYKPSDNEKLRMARELEVENLRLKEEARHEKEKLEKRKINYDRHVSAVLSSITLSGEAVDCLICLTTTDSGNGVRLQNCLHTFCKDCLVGHIMTGNDASVRCPYVDDEYSCNDVLQDREIRALLSTNDYETFLSRSLSHAETQSSSSFHCKTPDCIGWCEYEDGVNIFTCPVCHAKNCLTCQAIHDPKDCAEYQNEIKHKAATDHEAKKTKAAIEKMLRRKQAMHCPQCNIVIMRKDGCDWVQCTMCKLEICWVTRGCRWGPKGKGDNSGGCRCKVNGKKCHPDCINCH